MYPANSKKKGLGFSHVQLAAKSLRDGLGGLDDAQRGIANGLAQKLTESERLKAKKAAEAKKAKEDLKA